MPAQNALPASSCVSALPVFLPVNWGLGCLLRGVLRHCTPLQRMFHISHASQCFKRVLRLIATRRGKHLKTIQKILGVHAATLRWRTVAMRLVDLPPPPPPATAGWRGFSSSCAAPTSAASRCVAAPPPRHQIHLLTHRLLRRGRLPQHTNPGSAAAVPGHLHCKERLWTLHPQELQSHALPPHTGRHKPIPAKLERGVGCGLEIPIGLGPRP